MALQITATYAAVLALMMIGLSMYVSARRSKLDTSILYGDDTGLHERIRRHGNFVESVPIALIVIAMGEVSGLPAAWVHTSFLILIASRIIQPIGIRHDQTFTALRLAGNLGTFAAILIPVVFILSTRLH